MGRLAGKAALVTGSTRGIGRVIAEVLANEGAALIVTGRHDVDVARTVSELEVTGASVVGFSADLANPAGARRLAEQTLAEVPQLDILVNNAGMSRRESFWEVSDERWEQQVNVKNHFQPRIAQAAAPSSWSSAVAACRSHQQHRVDRRERRRRATSMPNGDLRRSECRCWR